MKPAIGIIPARYDSRRFPGKPLALIKGKPMIEWVYQNALNAQLLQKIILATDDERIARKAEQIGMEFYMTSSHHSSGTERAAEVAEDLKAPIIINIQGDEPLINGDMIDALVRTLQDTSIPMASLIYREQNLEQIQSTSALAIGCH